jgi:hypothetical protein
MKMFKFSVLLLLACTLSNCAESKKENSNAVEEISVVEKSMADNAIAEISVADKLRAETSNLDRHMYVIEREIPGAGDLTAEELKGISQVSCGVLDKMGSEIQWLHSYVTGDKVYCVYTAPNEEMVREHALQGGFPANSVSAVATVIDPSTAE